MLCDWMLHWHSLIIIGVCLAPLLFHVSLLEESKRQLRGEKCLTDARSKAHSIFAGLVVMNALTRTTSREVAFPVCPHGRLVIHISGSCHDYLSCVWVLFVLAFQNSCLEHHGFPLGCLSLLACHNHLLVVASCLPLLAFPSLCVSPSSHVGSCRGSRVIGPRFPATGASFPQQQSHSMACGA